MPLKDYVTGTTNKILVGGASAVGLIVTIVAGVSLLTPAYQVRNSSGQNVWGVDFRGVTTQSGVIASKTLANCNTIDGTSTGMLVCGTDTGGGGAHVNTGAILTAGDSRFVNISGDTMTGALTFLVTGGTERTISLEFPHTSSGYHLRLLKDLTVSGATILESSLTGATIAGFGLYDCEGSSNKITWDSSTQKFKCEADQNSGTSYTAGQGLTLTSTSFSVNGTLTGTLIRFTTLSGSIVKAKESLSSSGTLVWEGTASGATLWLSDLEGYAVDFDNIKSDDFGVFSCIKGVGCLFDPDTVSSSTIADDSVGTTELDDDSNTPAAGAFVIVETGDASFDYLSPNAGTDVTADLEEETHASEHNEGGGDALTVESLASSCTDAQVIGGNGAGGAECQTDANTTYTPGQGLTLAGTVFSLTPSHSGTTIWATTALRSSGTLVWEGRGSGDSLTIQKALSTSGALAVEGNANIDGALTLGTDLAVPQGGTGFGSCTDGGFVFGDATNALSCSSVLADDTVYIGDGTTEPTATTLPSCSAAGDTLNYNAGTNAWACGTDADTTYTAGQGLTLTSTAFSLSTTITGATLEFGTVSGTTVYATTALRSSGAVTWEGSASGASLYLGGSLNGAGLADCDADGATLSWDASTGRFGCGDDDSASVSAGQGLSLNGTVLTLNASHSGTVIRAVSTLSSSGTLVWEGAASGATLYLGGSLQGVGLTDCDLATQTLAWDATSGRFSCGTDSDTTYTAGQGLTLTSTAFSLSSTITGSTLEFQTVSGSTVYASKTVASSGALTWEGQGSGNSLYIGGTFEGAGLSDCDGDGQTLAWDATNKRFGCGDDDNSAGTPEVGTDSFSGSVRRVADTRYVKKQGDTMTGALVIEKDGASDTKFDVRVSSGAQIFRTAIGAGGNPFVEMEDVHNKARYSFNGDADSTWYEIYDNASNIIFDFFYDAGASIGFIINDDDDEIAFNFDVNPTYNNFQMNDDEEAEVLDILADGTDNYLEFNGRILGNLVQGVNTLASSGTLVWEGAGSGNSLYIAQSLQGVGLTDCDADNQTLSWNASDGRFGCGDDDGAAYTAGQGLTLTSSAFSLSSTISGSLLEFQTVSGALVYARTTLASSGSLVFEGAGSGNSLYIAGTTTTNGLNCVSCIDATDLAATTVTAATYGSALIVPVLTVDADGRLTNVTNTTFAGITGTHITDDVLDYIDLEDTMDLDANLSINSAGFVWVWNEDGNAAGDFRIEGDTDANLLVADATGAGNVGIGTAAPDARLDVIGTISGSSVVSVTAVSPAHMGAQVFSSGSTVQVGSGWLRLAVPSTMSGFNVVAMEAQVTTAGTTNTSGFQITNKSKGSRKIFSTAPTIDSAEKSTLTAATPQVVNATNDDVSGGDELWLDINTLSTTKPKGLGIVIIFRKP